jgi:hypothetical protein
MIKVIHVEPCPPRGWVCGCYDTFRDPSETPVLNLPGGRNMTRMILMKYADRQKRREESLPAQGCSLH